MDFPVYDFDLVVRVNISDRFKRRIRKVKKAVEEYTLYYAALVVPSALTIGMSDDPDADGVWEVLVYRDGLQFTLYDDMLEQTYRTDKINFDKIGLYDDNSKD